MATKIFQMYYNCSNRHKYLITKSPRLFVRLLQNNFKTTTKNSHDPFPLEIRKILVKKEYEQCMNCFLSLLIIFCIEILFASKQINHDQPNNQTAKLQLLRRCQLCKLKR